MVSIFAVWTGALLLAPAWAGAAGDTAHDAHAGHRTHDVRASGVELVVPIHRISAEGVHESIGTIVLRDGPEGLSVMPDLRGLEPGHHAFHIHENGDCGPGVADGKMVAGMAAGAHYGHGSHEGHDGKPAGDLPELVAGADGAATEAVTSGHLALSEVAGRSIMIHAHGEAEVPGGGPRMACGVIPDLL